ncbi:hypothetical protein B0H14DRAFT_3126197, partial [Mycena olivaceomarginata]
MYDCRFGERAFGEEGVRTLKMMDNGAKTQLVETFRSVLVNELFPWTGKASEGHPPGEENEIASLETEINPSPSPYTSQRTVFDSDRQIPEIASRGIGHNLGDDFGDGVFADDESNGKKLPEESDEEEVLDSPHESERDGDSSEDEVEGNDEEPDDRDRPPGESDEEAALRYHRERDGDSSEDEVEGNDDEEPDDEEVLPEESDEE